MFGKLLHRPQNIQTIYLYLVLGNTLATSFIWGINTIFLLNAGLSNFQAFLANAFFTLGEVVFEIPTGIVADTWGRRVSYLLGTITLSISTGLYLLIAQIHGPFWMWAASSVLLGLGYTFFSGATEAWLVDALHATNFKGTLDSVFSKGQIVSGGAMLVGSIGGGLVAQYSNLGVPYIIRSVILFVNFLTAFFLMRDMGFSPKKMEARKQIKDIFKKSIDNGLRNPPVRWLMFSAPFISGVSFYIFYALQPFLLQLYGNNKAYGIAGLTAAIISVSLIMGGIFAPKLRKLFSRRTNMLFLGTFIGGLFLIAVSQVTNFWVAIALIFVWGLIFAALTPVRQAYLNGIIPSEQRATVLSFDSLMGSSGGVVVQPILGKVADVAGYPASYLVSSVFQFAALPFIYLARRENAPSDPFKQREEKV